MNFLILYILIAFLWIGIINYSQRRYYWFSPFDEFGLVMGAIFWPLAILWLIGWFIVGITNYLSGKKWNGNH